MKLVAWLRRLAGTSLAIVLHHSALGRFKLLRTYWRISLKEKILVEFLGRRISQERIFSQTIYLGDYAAFVILFEEIFVTGQYFFASSSSAPYIIDGGANIGVSAAYFKTVYPDCRILAFEANERSFALLAKTSEHNKWKNVELYNFGLHRTQGELCFYDYNELAGSLSCGFWQPASAGPPKSVTRVPTVPLSRYVESRVNLLKLDVEGSEHAILKDLEERGKLQQIDQIVLEYHHHVQPHEDILGEFLLLLERAGFGYHIRASLALPFPRSEAQDFTMSAYLKRTP